MVWLDEFAWYWCLRCGGFTWLVVDFGLGI